MTGILLKPVDISLETIFLLMTGVMFVFLGILLIPVYLGLSPYYEDGVFGVLLVVISLQTIALGKNPLGENRHRLLNLIFGIIIAVFGIICCFSPDIFGDIPRYLLLLFFSGGGVILLLQMFFSKDKYPSWKRMGGIFTGLTAACAAVYLLEILLGIFIALPEYTAAEEIPTIGLAVLLGSALIVLGIILQKIRTQNPAAAKPVGISFDKASLILTGIFMVLLGILLIPVNFGMLPFSGSAQLGLLMIIFAVQMLALGSTPVGAYPRSRLMIILGFVFAVLGFISCVIPEILVFPLTILVGLLNISGGAAAIIRIVIPALNFKEATASMSAEIVKISVKIITATLVMNILTIIFGIGMLISGLIPGLVIGVVLALNGGMLFYLLWQITAKEKVSAASG